MTAEYQSKLAEMYRKYIRLNEKTEKMIQNDLKDIFLITVKFWEYISGERIIKLDTRIIQWLFRLNRQ